MNNLKKMMTLYALCAATCAAKAETISETEFMPVQKSGEIEGIRQGLVNGHLMVKSNGAIGSVATPYMFLNTNTTNFAQAGFTFKEMAEVNSLVIAKEDNQDVIYATRTNDTNNVYKFHVSPKNDLSGVGCVETIAATGVTHVATLNGNVMAFGKDKLYDLTTGENQFVNFQSGHTNTIYVGDRMYTIAGENKTLGYSYTENDVTKHVMGEMQEIQKWFYDENNGMIYYWGKDNQNQIKIFSLDVAHKKQNSSPLNATPANTESIAILSDGNIIFKTTDGRLVSNDSKDNIQQGENYVTSWSKGRYTYRVSDFATTKKRLSVERN